MPLDLGNVNFSGFPKCLLNLSRDMTTAELLRSMVPMWGYREDRPADVVLGPTRGPPSLGAQRRPQPPGGSKPACPSHITSFLTLF